RRERVASIRRTVAGGRPGAGALLADVRLAKPIQRRVADHRRLVRGTSRQPRAERTKVCAGRSGGVVRAARGAPSVGREYQSRADARGHGYAGDDSKRAAISSGERRSRSTSALRQRSAEHVATGTAHRGGGGQWDRRRG